MRPALAAVVPRIRHASDAPPCPWRWKQADLRDSCRPARRDSKGEFVANPGLAPWASAHIAPRGGALDAVQLQYSGPYARGWGLGLGILVRARDRDRDR